MPPFAQPRAMLNSLEKEILEEFEEETETVFVQDQNCYIHYKLMLKDEK